MYPVWNRVTIREKASMSGDWATFNMQRGRADDLPPRSCQSNGHSALPELMGVKDGCGQKGKSIWQTTISHLCFMWREESEMKSGWAQRDQTDDKVVQLKMAQDPAISLITSVTHMLVLFLFYRANFAIRDIGDSRCQRIQARERE